MGFLRWLLNLIAPSIRVKVSDVCQIAEDLDTDDDGYINVKELYRAVQKLRKAWE